jgi:hypothetical protein
MVVRAQCRVNNGASDAASARGYAPLLNYYRKRMIDSLGTITCNGSPKRLIACKRSMNVLLCFTHLT